MLALLLLAALPHVIDAQEFIRPCYFTNWAQYRPGRARFLPEDLEPNLCTHIIYAFAAIGSNFNVNASDPYDLPSAWAGDGMYKRVNALKKRQPGLKTLLSVGGGSFSVSVFKTMSSTTANRKTFITSVIKFVRQYGFDGIDLEWEFPAAADKANYVLLIKELREAFEVESKTERLLVTAAVGCSEATVKAGYDVKGIATYIDFVLLMTYDFQTTTTTEVSFSSALYPKSGATGVSATFSMEWAANFWVTQGMPKSKIIIGMTTYSRGFTLKDKTKIVPGSQCTGPSKPTEFVKEAGYAAYYETCEMIAKGATRYYDAVQESSYLVYGDQWFGYEDVASITIKANYVKTSGFGGCFAMSPDMDDFNGKCSNGGGESYPLITAINKVLVGASSGDQTAPTTVAQESTGGSGATAPPGSEKPSEEGFVRPCYYNNWAQYRPGRAHFQPEDFEPGLCTHIIYAYLSINANFTVKVSDAYDLASAWAGIGYIGRVTALKEKQHGLKTLISVGGGYVSLSLWKSVSATVETRKIFITSLIKFVRQYKFDGIEIDWEFPGAADKTNYALLIKELRVACDAESTTERLIVTAAVSCEETVLKAGYDITILGTYLDFVMLMTYDFQTSSSTEIGFDAPLFAGSGSETRSIEWAANFWVAQGMPKWKIIIGISTYSHGWTLVDKTKIEPGCEAIGPSRPTEFLGEAGVAAYYEICEMLAQGATTYIDVKTESSYIVYGDQWFTYESVTTITAKANYVKSNGFGGCFTPTPDLDDFNGKCSNGGGERWPLIIAVIEVLVGVDWRIIYNNTIEYQTVTPPVYNNTEPYEGLVDCSKGDGYFADPTTCEKFIRCESGTIIIFTCDTGTEFDPNCTCCTFPKEGGCRIGSTETPSLETETTPSEAETSSLHPESTTSQAESTTAQTETSETETAQTETTQTETTQTETTQTETTQTETTQTETAETETTETETSQTETSQTESSQTESSQTETAVTETAQTETSQTETAQTETSQTETEETETAETETSQTETAQTETSQTETSETESSQTDTSETEASQTDTAQTEVSQSETSQTEASETAASETKAPQTDSPNEQTDTSETEPPGSQTEVSNQPTEAPTFRTEIVNSETETTILTTVLLP